MNAPLVSCPFPVITFGWVCCCTHPKVILVRTFLGQAVIFLLNICKRLEARKVILHQKEIQIIMAHNIKAEQSLQIGHMYSSFFKCQTFAQCMFRIVFFTLSTVFPHMYSFRGKNSFLNLEIQRSQYIRPKVTVHKCAETIQGRKL